MKKNLLWFIFLFILSDSLYASCDSTVIQFYRKKKDGFWSTTSYLARTYNNGLLRKENHNGVNEIIYYYDSLNRVKEIHNTNFHNNSLYKTNYDYFYYLNGADSILIEYDSSFVNNQLNTHSTKKTSYFYDINLNLSDRISFNLGITWNTTGFSHLFYSPDSLIIKDSIYSPNSPYWEIAETTLDSLGRIIYYYSHSYAPHSVHEDISYFYDPTCIYNTSGTYYQRVVSGPLSIYTNNGNWVYDSLCRPLKCINTGTSDIGSGPIPSDSSEVDFYYLDCSQLLVVGIDTLINCPGKTDTLSHPLYAYGGTGSYIYSWTPAGLLSNDTILNPIILSDSNMVYVLTVHDSLGNSTTYQLTSSINSFTTVVTDASCNTCLDGSVNLVFPVPFPNSYLTITPYAGTWNGSTLTGLPVGDYLVCSASSSPSATICKICDSVHISSPNGIQILENKYISVYPNPTQRDFFVRVDPTLFHSSVSWLLSDSQGRELKKNTESNSQFKVDVADIANGIYYFEVFSADSPKLFRSVKKVVVFRSFQ